MLTSPSQQVEVASHDQLNSFLGTSQSHAGGSNAAGHMPTVSYLVAGVYAPAAAMLAGQPQSTQVTSCDVRRS